jgi:transposase
MLLHHDNAPTHISLKTTEFVTNNNMVIVPHPPYSPDLAPCDFVLFPKFKIKLKGRRFETVSDMRRESQAVLFSMNKNYFHDAFEAWKERWDRGTLSQRDCLKEMAAKLSRLSQHLFYDLVRELFDTPRISHVLVVLLI